MFLLGPEQETGLFHIQYSTGLTENVEVLEKVTAGSEEN